MKYVFSFVLILLTYSIAAQTSQDTLRGGSILSGSLVLKFVDSSSHTGLTGVNVDLLNSNGKIVYHGTTNEVGNVFFNRLPLDETFVLKYTAIGYQIKPGIKVKAGNKEKIISLSPASYELRSVSVSAKKDSVVIHGDTTIYNADLYRSKTDQNAGNILEKIPGAELKKGDIVIEGDKVSAILLDGKPYMKANNLATLDQVPADIIYRIEVIDNVSPEDPSGHTKTVNLVTKPKRLLSFGKLAFSYGTNNRYRGAGNYYTKTEAHRLTVMADANNVNKEDLLANILAPLFEGDNSLAAAGLNYQYQSKKNTIVNFNAVGNGVTRNSTESLNQYILAAPEEGPAINSVTNKKTKELVQNYDLEVELPISAQSKMTFRSDGDHLSSLLDNTTREQRYKKGIAVYNMDASTAGTRSKYLLNNSIGYNRDFARGKDKFVEKRSLSVMTSYRLRQEENFDSLIYVYIDTVTTHSWQLNTKAIPISTGAVDIDMSEHWGKKYTIKYGISGEVSSVNNSISASTYLDNSFKGGILDSSLSSDNRATIQKSSASFRIISKPGRTERTLGLDYERLGITVLSVFPAAPEFTKVFYRPLPMASFLYKQNNTSRIKFTFLSHQRAPSFKQLNPVIDNSVPSRSYLGRRELNAENKYTFDIESRKTSGWQLLHVVKLNATYTRNIIGEAILLPRLDSTVEGYRIKGGTQFIRPLNFDHQWNYGASFNHERNIKKGKYGIKYGLTYDILPSSLNSQELQTTVARYNTGLYWNYYPTKVLSIVVKSYGSYGHIENSGNSAKNRSVLNWNAGSTIRYLFRNSLLLDLESNTFQVKAFDVASNDRITSIVSFTARQALFANQRASILFQVHDIFNQNTDITQTPSAVYITQEQQTMLKRYFLLGFALKL